MTIPSFAGLARLGCAVALSPICGKLFVYFLERDVSFSHSVLDPILYDLFDPNIRYAPSTTELKGKQLQGFAYERPFDQRYINYLLETLLSVVKFGGQGFSKVARSTPISRSMYSNLLQRLQSGAYRRNDPPSSVVLIRECQ